MKRLCATVLLCAFAGCASTGEKAEKPGNNKPKANPATATPEAVAPQKNNLADKPKAALDIDITNVVGDKLPSRVDLLDFEGDPPFEIEVPKGALDTQAPVGKFRAYVHVYDHEVPVLAEIKDITITEGKTAYLLANILEGASGTLTIRNFDFDGDLAIDRVEVNAGTDPKDPSSVPGKARLTLDNTVLKNEAGWYRGELDAHSKYGVGTETVPDLVRRAEKLALDFLAITDRNTMAASADQGFHSDSVVLIPAMEWGSEKQGVALIYGPQTMPEIAGSVSAAQAECIRVQAQGGLFAIAHPCLPTAPWQWGLSYVNAIQVWFRDWRQAPPMALQNLRDDLKERKNGKLVQSIAAAAAEIGIGDLSANAEAAQFYDYECVRGLMAAIIGGSGTGSPKVPMASPVTYVYAKTKSLPGILEGLRLGRTYVSSGLKGPQVYFNADVLKDGKIDVGIGGVVPLNVDMTFEVGVINGAGKKLEVMLNGYPIITKNIVGNAFVQRFDQHPTAYSVYRVRVVAPAANPKTGFGPVDVFALTSPIYAQDITQELLWRNPKLDQTKDWVRLKPQKSPEITLPDVAPNGQLSGQVLMDPSKVITLSPSPR